MIIILTLTVIKKFKSIKRCFISTNNKTYTIRHQHINKLDVEKSKIELILNLNNLIESLFIASRTHSKIIILTLSSLISTFTLLIMVPFLKEYFDLSIRENQKNKSLLEMKLHFIYLNMCKLKKSFLIENYLLITVSLPLTIFLYIWNSFSFNLKKRAFKFDFIVPMNPFSKSNRFLTCIIYAAYIHNISKIFEFSLTTIHSNNNITINDGFLIDNLHEFQSFSTQGILIDLLLRVLNVFVIGFQFYPILLCIEFKLKSKLSYFLCTLYAWLMFLYFVLSNELCNTWSDKDLDIINYLSYMKTRLSIFLKEYFNQDLVDSSKLLNINKTFNNLTSYYKFEMSKLHDYKIEEFMFYFILCLIGATLNIDFILLVIKQFIKFNNETNFLPVLANKTVKCENEAIIAIKYTSAKLNEKNIINKTNFLKKFIQNNIYSYCKYFKFSKQFLNVNIISFILLFNATSFILNKSSKISSFCSFLIVSILKQLFMNTNNPIIISDNNSKNTTDKIAEQIEDVIIKSCLVTTSIYALQLIFSIKSYQSNVLKAYRGVYIDIPKASKYSNTKLAAGSLHYSGYAIGFLMIGFGIFFYVNLFLIFLLKIIIQIPLIQLDLIKYFLPFISIFLLKRLLIWYFCRYFLLSSKSNHLKNIKFYLIINHFNFFFDSFIIFFVSVLRIVYSLVAALFFFPRLDYRLFGLGLERFDMGFMSYVGFLHIEGLFLFFFFFINFLFL
jgi:hypothetical protein